MVDLMVGEKKAISRGVFRYNGPCGCQDGHCAVRKSVIYIYSIYICAQPSNRPLEHLFVVQPSYARPTHAYVRIGVWYHPHGACSGFWLSIFGTRLFLSKPAMRAKAHEAGSQVSPSRMVSRVNQSADVASQGAYGQAMMWKKI